MTTNRGCPLALPLDKGISRQTFLRGAASVLATGAVFGTTRAAADPGVASGRGDGMGWYTLSVTGAADTGAPAQDH